MNQDEIIRVSKCLGIARSFLQWHVKGGDTCIWGSQQTLPITVKQIEDLAIEVAEQAVKSVLNERGSS